MVMMDGGRSIAQTVINPPGKKKRRRCHDLWAIQIEDRQCHGLANKFGVMAR